MMRVRRCATSLGEPESGPDMEVREAERNGGTSLTPTGHVRQQRWRPRLPKRAVDGDLVESVLESGELLVVELRDEQFRDST
jgi:hypothetical protein